MSRIAPLATLIALLPAGLVGQGITVTPFVADNRGVVGSPPLVGLSTTAWSRWVGVRMGGAVDMPSSPVARLFGGSPSGELQAWQGDVDLVFDVGRAGLRLGTVDPRAFVGLGFHGGQRDDGSGGTIPVWSYGGGGLARVTDWFGVELEVRYRSPHDPDPASLPLGVRGGWEARVGLAVRLGGGTGARPAPRHDANNAPPAGGMPPAGEAVGTPAAGAAAVALQTLLTAERYVGVPYTWGGSSPAEGFDCSGFVRYVYAAHGIDLPRVSRDQAAAGVWLPPDIESLEPGDLMFYEGPGGVINHVAIYAGGGQIIHSSASGAGVRYDDLNTLRGRYYATRMVAARRVILDEHAYRLSR